MALRIVVVTPLAFCGYFLVTVFSLVINQSLVLRFSFYSESGPSAIVKRWLTGVFFFSLNIISYPVANVWPCNAPV